MKPQPIFNLGDTLLVRRPYGPDAGFVRRALVVGLNARCAELLYDNEGYEREILSLATLEQVII